MTDTIVATLRSAVAHSHLGIAVKLVGDPMFQPTYTQLDVENGRLDSDAAMGRLTAYGASLISSLLQCAEINQLVLGPFGNITIHHSFRHTLIEVESAIAFVVRQLFGVTPRNANDPEQDT